MNGMKNKTWLILLAGMAVVLLAASIGVTTSAFTDTEQSTDNFLMVAAPVTMALLDDGFEGTPWDVNWDGNGTTAWVRTASKPHSGSYAALSDKDNNGYLASDDLNASAAVSITVSFWFKPKGIETGDMLVQLYNGSTYNAWYDIVNYPSYQNNTWSYFSEKITASQYFIPNFRLRFDSSGLVQPGEDFRLDDVLITINRWP